MTYPEFIRKALDTRDARLAVNISEQLRFKHGCSFATQCELVRRSGRDHLDWIALIDEGDNPPVGRPPFHTIKESET